MKWLHDKNAKELGFYNFIEYAAQNISKKKFSLMKLNVIASTRKVFQTFLMSNLRAIHLRNLLEKKTKTEISKRDLLHDFLIKEE